MGKNNMTCMVCGEQYEYCPSCRAALTTPRWKSLYDTENCKIIFETTSDFLQKSISKEQAKAKLENCDLNKQYRFPEKVRGAVKEIMYQAPVVVSTVVEDTEVQDATPKYVSRKRKQISED